MRRFHLSRAFYAWKDRFGVVDKVCPSWHVCALRNVRALSVNVLDSSGCVHLLCAFYARKDRCGVDRQALRMPGGLVAHRFLEFGSILLGPRHSYLMLFLTNILSFLPCQPAVTCLPITICTPPHTTSFSTTHLQLHLTHATACCDTSFSCTCTRPPTPSTSAAAATTRTGPCGASFSQPSAAGACAAALMAGARSSQTTRSPGPWRRVTRAS